MMSDYLFIPFPSIKQVMEAGEILKKSGIEVLLIPKRTPDCGVYLLFPESLKDKVIKILSNHNIKSEEVLRYEEK